MRKRAELENSQKLNLIPLMDAVFIFIFFLLTSSDLQNFREIHAAIPKIKEVDDNSEMKENPLNLKVKVSYQQIQISTGLEDTVIKTIQGFGEKQLEKLANILAEIKSKNPKENDLSILPSEELTYEDIIKVMEKTKASDIKEKEVNYLFQNIALIPL